MSTDESPNVPAPRDRREAVREKAQKVHVKQSRVRVLRRTLIGAAGLVLVGGAAVGVTWALTEMGPDPQLEPTTAQQDGFVITSVSGMAREGIEESVDDAAATLGAAAAPTPTATPTQAPPVDIRVYVDYLSPNAREFQLANSEQLSDWVSQDAATLTYYPVAMLTSKSNGTKYSLRAASAAACVASHDPESFSGFNNHLLLAQPEVDSDGLSDVEIADIAQASGVSPIDAVRDCIEDEAFSSWARAATDRALESLPDTDGIALTATPMILVNGVQYVGKLGDAKEFAQFVTASASDAYFRTASPAPAPSATASATPAP
jgi:hypothetical protein